MGSGLQASIAFWFNNCQRRLLHENRLRGNASSIKEELGKPTHLLTRTGRQ